MISVMDRTDGWQVHIHLTAAEGWDDQRNRDKKEAL